MSIEESSLHTFRTTLAWLDRYSESGDSRAASLAFVRNLQTFEIGIKKCRIRITEELKAIQSGLLVQIFEACITNLF